MAKRPRKTLPKRDSRGRFVSSKSKRQGRSGDRGGKRRYRQTAEGAANTTVRGSIPRPVHPLAGQIVVNHFSGEVYTYDRSGRLRTASGQFAKTHHDPVPESDGRIRPPGMRMTFTEAIEFYEYDTQQLPDWIFYLVGSP